MCPSRMIFCVNEVTLVSADSTLLTVIVEPYFRLILQPYLVVMTNLGQGCVDRKGVSFLGQDVVLVSQTHFIASLTLPTLL